MKHAHTRRSSVDFHWPQPPLQVVLVHPEIPPNTGNIARLCAATGTALHLVEPLGFAIDNAKLRRAGLDYWDAVVMGIHPDISSYMQKEHPARFFLFSTGGNTSYLEPAYQPGDALVFGSETQGLPDELLRRYPEQVRVIPVRTDLVRSLNLSNAVSIVLYEALRQIQTQHPV